MAFYFGLTRGGNGFSGCAVGTSTTGKELEIVVGNTITDKQTVLMMLEQLECYITQNGWPPM